MLNLHQMQYKFVLNITKKVILLYIPVQKTGSNELPIIKKRVLTLKFTKKYLDNIFQEDKIWLINLEQLIIDFAACAYF